MSTEPEPRHLTPFLVLTIATVVLYVSVLVMAIWNFNTSHSNHEVLCALKAARQRDIVAGEKFLIDNPKGIEGISAELIQLSIDDDKQVLKSFASLDCPSDQ